MVENRIPAEQSSSHSNFFLRHVSRSVDCWIFSAYQRKKFNEIEEGLNGKQSFDYLDEGARIAAFSFAFMEAAVRDDRKIMDFKEISQLLEESGQPVLALSVRVIAKRTSESLGLLNKLRVAQLSAIQDKEEKDMVNRGMQIVWDRYPLGMVGKDSGRTILKLFPLPKILL